MDPSLGMTALIKEETELNLYPNSNGAKPRKTPTRGLAADMFQFPAKSGSSLEAPINSSSRNCSIFDEEKPPLMDGSAVEPLIDEKSSNIRELPGAGASGRALLNAQEQHQLMADFNKQLCSLAPSIDVILAENMDHSFPRKGYFPPKRGVKTPAPAPKQPEDVKPVPLKIGRSFRVKSNQEPEEVPQTVENTQFKKTADGGLKPIFDDDDEEESKPAPAALPLPSTSTFFEEYDREHSEQFESMIRPGEDPQMARVRYFAKMRARKYRAKLKPVFKAEEEESAPTPAAPTLPSTSTPFEEFDQEHAEQFEDMVRPGEDPRMARVRYMAKMRARKYRAKATLERKIRLGLVTAEQITQELANSPLARPIEEEFKPTPMNNLDTGLVKAEEPEMNSGSEGGMDILNLLGNADGEDVVDPHEVETKRKRAETQRLRRAMLSEERKLIVREQNRIRQKQFRERRKREVELGVVPTPDIIAYHQKKAEQAEKMRIKRAVQSDEQKALEREKNTSATRIRRQMESEEQRRMRRQRDANAQRARRFAVYLTETEEQKAERKKVQAEKRRQFRMKAKGDGADTSSTGDEFMSSSRELSLESDSPFLPVEYPQE